MLIMATETPLLRVPVAGTADIDVTTLPVELALVADDGAEPAGPAWRAATWLPPDPPLRPHPVTELLIDPPPVPGLYMLWVRVTDAASGEVRVLPSGRVRVGDTRT